ncbi:Outer-membrane lipoprotein carrier protein [Paraburkholderia aspalathi]|uniref:Outer-membrane lipoprotein carrier protein n=1 Tax=Paraburkholderia aspalathi TaxID=1324617 RepID=A0ABM8QJG6_9BURK|nr:MULTISPECIES: outer membrane lipoprotein carrier protein LolA [Paraburkholderia]MBK3817302.1 outer membrane lipoprotein carrier protein LolA [Paraburkholderia aspalathi]MBK3829154.1 outer membrane lipoprotein carrier protein LolA [Paraburkholderia aspalathi]MBK3836684.1 outer membrane lipoprotein carrier protein LolA [Paraburkholderia aspalathi]MBK3858839.1 outer membrane lipoprotein carrier protein LolA [Paraburkholderia aspalathi]MCX4140899.1 outer membrane lipoprotein carrier protein Lol
MGTISLRGVAAGALLGLGTLSVSSLAAWPTAASAAEAAQSAGNPALVSQIASRLAQAKGVRAQFTQTQTLAAMKQPLVSTGSLLFVRDRGVIWQIDTPYKATYVITDAGVAEVDANGQRVTAHSAQGTRGVAQVSKMMRAMLGGDLSALYSQFDVQAEGSAAQWRMQLTPNQPQIAQSIKGLQMNGGDYLQSLRITLANGDITKLDFAKSAAVSEPTPAERSLLGAP